MKLFVYFEILLITLFFLKEANAQSTIGWSSFDMGYANSSGTSSSITSLVGQPFMGTSKSENALISSGFSVQNGQQLTFSNDETIPIAYRLDQNYPNPFNPTTRIDFRLPIRSKVNLRVYNDLGQIMAMLVDEVLEAGSKSIEWNASTLAGGIYFYRIEATSTIVPNQSLTSVKKMILLK